jgi:hypothetical protein
MGRSIEPKLLSALIGRLHGRRIDPVRMTQ